LNILLLSTGGGGGNILRSLKALFRRDLLVTQKTDARYAERLRRAITTKFLDTNEFSLNDLPKEERLVIGAGTTRRMGSMHNPDMARKALDESRDEVASLLNRHSVVIVIGTGGKGTGAGTIFPIAHMARHQKKLVIPIFVRPSFERHEVEKRRYDHALQVADQFDTAGIRLMEILNDRGYRDADPEPQPVVWERMNLPIARGLRGLLYVLWDLSQVDPSDLSVLFAGPGRMRMGFSELDPQNGQEPSDDQIRAAVQTCWENPYAAFDGIVGTSLICIQGHWSNVVDGKIKAQLAALALRKGGDSPYNPLHARAVHAPRPWGVTTLFAEYTGLHAPLDIDWSAERRTAVPLNTRLDAEDAIPQIAEEPVAMKRSDQLPVNDVRAAASAPPPLTPAPGPAFSTFWDFARALNRSDAAALKLASDGVAAEMTMDGRELKKLLGTFWFRSVFPRLSPPWQDRMLNVLVDDAIVTDHAMAIGRRPVHLREMTAEERQRMLSNPDLPDTVRADLQFVDAIARHWGDEALKRLTFTAAAPTGETSRLGALLQPFRHG
jgi:cell division GTPase FtsZ